METTQEKVDRIYLLVGQNNTLNNFKRSLQNNCPKFKKNIFKKWIVRQRIKWSQVDTFCNIPIHFIWDVILFIPAAWLINIYVEHGNLNLIPQLYIAFWAGRILYKMIPSSYDEKSYSISSFLYPTLEDLMRIVFYSDVIQLKKTAKQAQNTSDQLWQSSRKIERLLRSSKVFRESLSKEEEITIENTLNFINEYVQKLTTIKTQPRKLSTFVDHLIRKIREHYEILDARRRVQHNIDQLSGFVKKQLKTKTNNDDIHSSQPFREDLMLDNYLFEINQLSETTLDNSELQAAFKVVRKYT